MTDSESSAAAGAFAVFAFLAILALQITWGGYVLYVLWAWFIVPIFAAPVLSVPAAIGVRLVVRACYGPSVGEQMSFSRSLSMSAIGPLFLLGIGWIVKTFV